MYNSGSWRNYCFTLNIGSSQNQIRFQKFWFWLYQKQICRNKFRFRLKKQEGSTKNLVPISSKCYPVVTFFISTSGKLHYYFFNPFLIRTFTHHTNFPQGLTLAPCCCGLRKDLIFPSTRAFLAAAATCLGSPWTFLTLLGC